LETGLLNLSNSSSVQTS